MDVKPVRDKVLCVDDDPAVLAGLALHLQRRYDVVTAEGAGAGLDLLARDRSIAIVVSDLRMPGMDGAEFLGQARRLQPDAIRVLLTGHLDFGAAVAAVNAGQVFRLLTKPCPPQTLLAAVAAAAEQRKKAAAERARLDATVRGAVQALVDLLSLVSPVAFGRAMRIKQHALEIADHLGLQERWPLEAAAMLSQLGCVALPAETVERHCYGRPLSEIEQALVAHLPAQTEQLLANVPRLETVREILATLPRSFRAEPPSDDPRKALAQRFAHVLRVALDFDLLESQGHEPAIAVDTLRGRHDVYDPTIVAALAAIRAASSQRKQVRELTIGALGLGMVFAEDVRLASGTLLVARGYEVTRAFLARISNFRPGTIREPVRVVISTGIVPITTPSFSPQNVP